MTPEEFVAALEERILGPRRLTADELMEQSGADVADAEELWMGLGFPLTEMGTVYFNDADLEALASLVFLREIGIAGPELAVSMTRVLGQALSRVAAAQVEAFREQVAKAVADAETPEQEEQALAGVTDVLLPGFEHFINYVFRRHLVAAIRRELVEHRSASEVVAFADLVDYTRGTRDYGDDELSDLLQRFQHAVYEQVTSVDGRIVKIVGDGAMFAAPTPEAAATAALGLVQACALDEKLKGVRVGLARGHLVAVDGDIFGETVNRASRLADEAYPHSVLADDDTGEALAAGGRFTVVPTKPRRLKGLGVVRSWVVRPSRVG